MQSKVKNKEDQNCQKQGGLLCQLLLDFSKNTTLHGVRYAAERGLSLIEKYVSRFLPIQAFKPLEEENYKNPLPSDDWELILKLSWIRLICKDASGAFMSLSLQHFLKSSYFNHHAVQNIIQVAPKIEDIYHFGHFQGNYLLRGSTYGLSPVLTEEGVCFTFNSLAADELLNMEKIQRNYSYFNKSTPRRKWSLEGGYSSSSHDTYPKRGRASGVQPDLTLDLLQVKTRDSECDKDESGFKVYLHHPSDFPQSSLHYYLAVPGHINSFALSADILKPSESLHRCPLRIRQCYFPREKELRYFRIYSQNNCRLECIANYTLARCGCVWFHMPHNDSTVLCHFKMKYCVSLALELYISEDGMTSENTRRCQCLPSCASVRYKAEVLKTASNLEQCINCSSALDQTLISMYFKEPFFVSRARECKRMFELTDFLAYCGGLLGLFLGFSFLSLVEIFYFCTLRLGCVLRRDIQAAKTMEAEPSQICK